MAPVLGALFAILIGFLAIRPYLGYQQQSFQNIQAANTASQFRQFINASEAYIQANCLPSQNGGQLPSTCQNIPLSNLQAGGYLPTGTNLNSNPYGQAWNISIIPSANSSGGVIALLYSSGGQSIPTKLAAQIAAETGQEGGFVPILSLNSMYGLSSSSQLGAVGAYGHWSLTPLSNYLPSSSSIAPGDLVALLNVGPESASTLNGDYLYRTAVQEGDKVPAGTTAGSYNTMQTDLGMSGHAVENTDAVTVTSSTPSAIQSLPFMAEITGTTNDPVANNPGHYLPGGMVATEDKNGSNMAVMRSDANGADISLGGVSNSNISDDSGSQSTLAVDGGSSSSLTVGTDANVSSSLPSSSSSLSVTGGSSATLSVNGASSSQLAVGTGSGSASLSVNGASSSTLTIGNNNKGNDTLTFISQAQTAGSATNCNAQSAGTIAPDSDGSGIPLVCVNNSYTDSTGTYSNYLWNKMVVLTGSGQNMNINSFYTDSNFTAQNGPNALVMPNQEFTNSSGGPEFVSSYCTGVSYNYFINQTAYLADINIAVFDPSGNQVSQSEGRTYQPGNILNIFGNGTAYIPSASAMVPNGFSFEIVDNSGHAAHNPNWEVLCSLMITE